MNLFQQTLVVCFAIMGIGSGADYQVLFLKDPFVPLRQPHMESIFRCVHMHGLRVSVADKEDTIMHWALAGLLMRDAVFFSWTRS